MSGKKVSRDIYEDRNVIRKQIGCMNGIFQLFDRQHFLSGWNITSNQKHKRLLMGVQKLEPQNAKKEATEKEMYVQKQKPRASTESSSQASSAFSSSDHNKTQPTNISESPFHIIATGPQTQSDNRNVVKDSMHREARGVSIKSFTNVERKVTVIKHIDSPRPSRPVFEKPELKTYEESTRVFNGDQLALHRFSCDGRDTRDHALKTKQKELLPRLSLDSKASLVKGSARDSRLEFSSQESGSHSRSSSIIAKLMGLDDFPNTITTDESEVTTTKPSPSPRVTERAPMEPAPWKQNDSIRDSPKMATKYSTNTRNLKSSSVYAEMEKRITELEFKRSGKDLRALKQILEAMHKTRDKLENGRREPGEVQKQKQCVLENSRPDQDSATLQHRKTYHRAQVGPDRSCSPTRITKSAKVTENVKFSKPAGREKVKGFRPSRHFSSTDNKTTLRNLDNRITTPSSEVKNKKAKEICSQNRRIKVKSMDFQLCDSRLSDHSVGSQLLSEVKSSASSTNPSFREHQNHLSTLKEHTPTVEQPSPVSVLDSAFYIEDLPSPVKMKSTVFRDEGLAPDEAEWPLENRNHFSDLIQSNRNSQNVLPLIHNDEPVNQSLTPDHRYINEILAASRLFNNTCIMPTTNSLLNPDIFQFLEETQEKNGQLTQKNDRKKLNQKKMQRRIVFDTVNEMLVRKITTDGLFTLLSKRMGPQGLMKELYVEIDRLCGMKELKCNLDDEDDESIRLVAADMKYRSDEWTDYSGEAPALVLEIERLIFKDLINEVVINRVEGLHDWPKRHCRQLFTM